MKKLLLVLAFMTLSIISAEAYSPPSGTGNTIHQTGASIINANLNTPSALNLLNATGYPTASNSGLGLAQADGLTINSTAGVLSAVVGPATTNTFTNKTFDTAGTGNSFKINGTAITSISGNTSKVATATGTLTNGHCVQFDTSGNIADAGGACTISGGTAFSGLTSSTNTTAAMVVGTGASLAASGSGTITATAVPASGLTGITLASSVTSTSIPCSGLSNGATGCSTATGTSGATLPLLNGTNTWANPQTFTSAATAASFIPTSSTIPTNGLYLPAANTAGLSANSQPVIESLGVASAVDYMLVTNAATANPASVLFTASGTDTNIGEKHLTKGTGQFVVSYTGGDGANNYAPFSIDVSGGTISTNPAFKILLPASGQQKAFQFTNNTDTTAWGSFEFNIGGTGLAGLSLGAGGSSARDLYLYRASSGVLDIGTASGNASGTINAATANITGTATVGTLSLTNALTLPNASTATTQVLGDATTKVATDAFVANAINDTVDMKDPAAAATNTALILSPTYANGSSGVGATLTAGTVGVLIVDGYTPALNDRILVKNQASTFQNGCYKVTTLGVAVTTAYVLTRCTDYDQTADIIYGTTFPVLNGTTNANQQFTMNNNTAITVGTTAITYAQTSGGSQLTAGTGISVTGNTVAVSTVPAANGGTNADSSAATGIAQVASGVWSWTTALVNGTTATTQSANDNSTKVATTAYVDAKGLSTNTYTSSTTWTKPSSGTMVHVEIWSGGGAGASRATTGNASGGGGGGYYDLWAPIGSFASTETVTVGASAAGVSGNNNGTTGNDSSFTVNGISVLVKGAQGGQQTTTGVVEYATASGGPAAFASSQGLLGSAGVFWMTSQSNILGNAFTTTAVPGLLNAGLGGDVSASNVPEAGSYSILGGGGGGGCSSTAGGVRTGGASASGGAGGAGGANTGGAATAGTAPSGGGGGAVQAGTSGVGARGQVRVTVF